MLFRSQYMNDIERDRRGAPSDYLIRQFARVLSIKAEYLYYLAGELPADLQGQKVDEATVVAAYEAFRKRLRNVSRTEAFGGCIFFDPDDMLICGYADSRFWPTRPTKPDLFLNGASTWSQPCRTTQVWREKSLSSSTSSSSSWRIARTRHGNC
mgnify:CR=1 FL=1